MRNYAAGDPVGNNQQPIRQAPAPFKAIVTRISENATASSVISLSHNTTALEIAAQGSPALIRWIATTDTEASVFGNASIMTFDHVIPSNTVRRFVVPVEVTIQTQSVQGANRANGLFQRVAWKTNGVASVFMTEYGSSNSY